jgi:hypothetical protein
MIWECISLCLYFLHQFHEHALCTFEPVEKYVVVFERDYVNNRKYGAPAGAIWPLPYPSFLRRRASLALPCRIHTRRV